MFGIDVYPYGNFAIPLFPLIMTYAFLRYRLIDVNFALIRGLTFLTIYVFVVGIPLVMGYFYQAFWQSVLGPWWWLAPVMLMGILAAASPVLFYVLVQRLEQRVWRAQRRYHRTLIAASTGMTRIKDLRRLCRLIVYVVNRTVGLLNTGLFLANAKQECFELAAVRYPKLLPSDLVVKDTEALISLLQQERSLVRLEELERMIASRKETGPRLQQIEEVCAWMHQLEVRLVVPSFTNERLLAFLALSAKRNGESYTPDDVAIFSGLANQATLGIENALFFEELKTNEAYMIQSEKLASLGQLASGMAHEIHNPLTSSPARPSSTWSGSRARTSRWTACSRASSRSASGRRTSRGASCASRSPPPRT